MKGLIAAAVFAVVATVVLSFAASSGFTFRNLDSAPVVVDRGLPPPYVEIEKDGVVVTSDESNAGQLSEPPAQTRAQPIVEVVKKPIRKRSSLAEKTRPKVVGPSGVLRKPVAKVERPHPPEPERPAPAHRAESLEPERPLTLQEQIEQDREWRRKTLERWEREERERQKKQQEKTRRAVHREFDERGKLRNPDPDDYMEAEEVERIMKRAQKG